MKLNRMFEIIYLLLEKKRMTSAELATHFEVSKRTILRDIEALSIVGIPIYTAKGHGGGISLVDNFVLNKRMLSSDDRKHILFALQSLVEISPATTETTLIKMRSFFDLETTDWLSVDFSRWGHEQADTNTFSILKTAILQQQVVSFNYANSYGENQERTVHPLKLVFKGHSWYLCAFCTRSEQCKIYKINRMDKVTLTAEKFSREKLVAPNSLETQTISNPQMIALELRFSKEFAFRAYDEFSPDDIRLEKEGAIIVTVTVPEDQWIYSYLLSLGTGVKVLSPQHVKVELLKLIENVQKSYEE